MVTIEILANDRNGLVADITTSVNEIKGKINAIMARVTQERVVVVNLELQLQDVDHLTKVLKAIRKVDSVFEVRRKKG